MLRYCASVLALVPGIFAIVSDPDVLGIVVLLIFALPVYLAWRNNIAGGIILIAVGALMLGVFFIDRSGPAKIPRGAFDLLTWAMTVVFPAAAGILFILAGKKRRATEPQS